MSPHIIGVSGKIGSGKDYFATKVTKVLTAKGYSVGSSSFARPLKEEAGALFRDLLPAIDMDETRRNSYFGKFALRYDIPEDQFEHLYSLVEEELKENPHIDGYTRSEGVRQFLQFLGTDVRRNQYENYWVERFYDGLDSSVDFIFATDTRFANEADFALTHDGTVIRIEVPQEIIEAQTKGRDGLEYSTKALNHLSETALDNYEHFSIVVGRDFVDTELADFLINRLSSQKNEKI